jgi:carnitine 3-dehydrogenase
MTRRVAVVGAGTVGASWAAIFLARGFEVAATDPAADAEDFARHFINNAWPTLQKLGLVVPSASAQRMSFHRGVAAAVNGAEFVQENGPEREDLKIELFAEIDAALPDDTVIASSSSSLLISRGNALKHGRYTADAIARRREIGALLRAVRTLITEET